MVSDGKWVKRLAVKPADGKPVRPLGIPFKANTITGEATKSQQVSALEWR